ncbi:hypothetical protein [Rhizobium terrae]|uniref:hypothetical protein n=1 Tax=Rhizobium terrae TaxID=2171756 RepID=UPI000E3D9A35|nr:hypothetical protein [Rhizobium terrae]
MNLIGLMLSLAGLVGTFFNIQLSQWLRDLVALEQKVELNKRHANESQQKAIVECRIEFRKLSNGDSYRINIAVLIFVIFVLCDGILMASTASGDALFPHVMTALVVFLIFFVGMSLWLFRRGSATTNSIKTMLDSIK